MKLCKLSGFGFRIIGERIDRYLPRSLSINQIIKIIFETKEKLKCYTVAKRYRLETRCE